MKNFGLGYLTGAITLIVYNIGVYVGKKTVIEENKIISEREEAQ